MNKLTEKTVAARVALTAYAVRAVCRVRAEERGQANVEYVGVILVVVAIVGAVIAGITTVDEAIVKQLTDAINKIGGGAATTTTTTP
ncbi:hypothetical protein APR04_002018 [Promicromonospora umidemergens]|nr:hypothetical protein [Promicromonospora umidemergens]MCP2283115.1 hypothetical protein [Promicromonospora umidemergens]